MVSCVQCQCTIKVCVVHQDIVVGWDWLMWGDQQPVQIGNRVLWVRASWVWIAQGDQPAWSASAKNLWTLRTLENSRELWSNLEFSKFKDFLLMEHTHHLGVVPWKSSRGDAVLKVSVSIKFMTYYNTSHMHITTRIAAWIAHLERSLCTAKTAALIQSIHGIVQCVYPIDPFTKLITPHLHITQNSSINNW